MCGQRSRNFERNERCRVRLLTENGKRTHAMTRSVAAKKKKTAAAAAVDIVRGAYRTCFSNVDSSCAAPSQLLLLILILLLLYM